ncbi:MAG TPA: septum formation initiator family protein [Erysipelothrix sp.]
MSEIAINRSHKSKKWLSFVVVSVLLLASVFFLSKTVKDVMTTFQLKQELKIVEKDLETLKTRQSELTLEKAKLEDPGYVQNYARGTHLLSKSEEQVFILPKGKR